MTKPRTYARHIEAYAGFDVRDRIAWGTIRATREETAAVIERQSPTVEGYPAPLRIMPVFVGLDLNRQLDMLDRTAD